MKAILNKLYFYFKEGLKLSFVLPLLFIMLAGAAPIHILNGMRADIEKYCEGAWPLYIKKIFLLTACSVIFAYDSWIGLSLFLLFLVDLFDNIKKQGGDDA